ncbi:hypothetical protein MG290_06330 [Flavobacterium sp. CBA20B-1]|uniref:hypothetical protein n=1 Tax=unclassified Flavobacterium TaxID=196869 RepID=UPI002223F691|nr:MULTISPECIES: hypothetical protein [unclassified Flavobacterium]WCM43272.1 hypothetical protein MG290_06330 [Flavobacterium sp. CBA20B-1]
MLKKGIIGIYCGLALFLMSFSVQQGTSFSNTNMQNQPIALNWQVLGNISNSLRVMANYGATIKESFHGKKITISGYIIPVDSKSYVLSKNVYSHCFFCSTSAGIETVMGIQFKGKTPRLKTDTYVTLEGTFFYNDTNKDDWTFSVHEAVIASKK